MVVAGGGGDARMCPIAVFVLVVVAVAMQAVATVASCTVFVVVLAVVVGNLKILSVRQQGFEPAN